jgi:hypothetical protein
VICVLKEGPLHEFHIIWWPVHRFDFHHKTEKAFWKNFPSWYQLGNDFFDIQFGWIWVQLNFSMVPKRLETVKILPQNGLKPKFPSWYQLGKNPGTILQGIPSAGSVAR